MNVFKKIFGKQQEQQKPQAPQPRRRAYPEFAEREGDVKEIIRKKLPDLPPADFVYEWDWTPTQGSFIRVDLEVPHTGARIPIATLPDNKMTAKEQADVIIEGLSSIKR